MEHFYRGQDYSGYAEYRVTIEQPGPRGGKRPPLIDATVCATSHDDAVDYVHTKLWNRLKVTVVG